MNLTLLLLRVVHILCGVYWAGTIFFFAHFLEPVVRGAGPAGAPIMQGLQARGYLAIMPAIAIVSILSGTWLLWMDSNGFSAAWMATHPGIGFSTGALFAVAALGVGLSVMRPTVARMAKLAGEASLIPEGPARAAHLAPLPALRHRITLASRWMAALLVVAVGAMAVSRYLG